VVTIPPPPKRDQRQQPLWQAAVPLITIFGYVIVSATGQNSNISFILPMVLTVFISTGLTVYTTLNDMAAQREKEKAYVRRLVELRREMVASHQLQRNFYQYNYPDTPQTLEMTGGRKDNRGGSRLWERRTADNDFGAVRLGIGSRKSTVEFMQKNEGTEEETPLVRDARRLQEDSRFVTDVPITIPLYQPLEKKAERRRKEQAGQKEQKGQAEDRQQKPADISKGTQAARHTMGISGDAKDVYEFIFPLVSHMVAFHAPNDLSLYVLGTREAAPQWSWLYELPHTHINPAKGQYRLYFEDGERVLAPADGRIEKLLVQTGKTVRVGQPIAQMRRADNGQVIDILAPTSARVNAFGLLDVPVGEDAPLIDAGRDVKAGQLICRLEDFDLPVQQLEEELDPRKGLQQVMGKKRKRDVAGVPRFWKEKVWSELDRRARRLRDSGNDDNDATDITLPFMLIVVDMMNGRPDLPDAQNPLKASWLDDLEGEAAIAMLMEQGAKLGAAVLFLVPARSKIPSGCNSLVELKRDADNTLKFLYAETGLNSRRYVGEADTVVNPEGQPNRKLFRFAKAIAEWDVRRGYGADIPRAVGLLSLYDDARDLSALEVPERWRESKNAKRAEWPKIPLGMLAGQEPRYLHFFADADGVHGMVAGSTGSGKSELLMTIILSLAVKYDPAIVNFVLIDFKGGAAFDPFRDLPHVVDIVTNLRGNAVARMFAAINAELNRRQQVNQDNGTKDIVRYRRNNLHNTRNDNYPHLFIIVDEFAEMIANNPEYKAQLDSITRLGRALGVSLILAAQRPTGVTDQMRANIKFRISLRVETREESSELLRLPDAAYLPSIPGRGYLQVGSSSLELVQVGYTGEAYNRADYDPFERYSNRPLIWESDLGKEEDEPMYDVMVRRMRQLSDRNYGDAPRWRKPWPNPLPTYIALDRPDGIEVEYFVEEDEDWLRADLSPEEPFVLAPAIPRWMSGVQTGWKPVDWETRAMRAVVGLIDNPSMAKLHTLMVDFTAGHFAIFGASGWGKSIFVRSVVTSLISTHAPDDLHLYFLDFGSRALGIFEEAPHTGAFIISHEKERIERLMRMLESIVDTRKELLAKANVANIYEYNQQAGRRRRGDMPTKLPAILVAIDNFAEFRASYENLFDILISLAREGLANGLHFIFTGEQSSALGKLFNLVTEKISLKLADDTEYSTIVGRGALPVEEIAGRGLRRVDRSPLELQVAMPLAFLDDEVAKTESERLAELIGRMREAGKAYTPPPRIDVLETWAVLPTLLHERTQMGANGHLPAQIVLGRADFDLQPLVITLDAKPHFMIGGPPSSGKTTALQTLILSLVSQYAPDQVAMILADYQGGIADYGGTRRLDELPHMLMPVITEAGQLRQAIDQLENEFVHNAATRTPREVYFIVDAFEDFGELTTRDAGDEPRKRLGDLARRYGKQGFHIIICGMRDGMSSSDDVVRPIAANRFGLSMDVETAESSPFYGQVPRALSQSVLPRGRGFLVQPGRVSMLQIAVPYADPTRKIEALDTWIESILSKGQARAQWPEMKGGAGANGSGKAAAASGNGASASAPAPAVPPPAALDEAQKRAIIGGIAEKMDSDIDTLYDAFKAYDDRTLKMVAGSYGVAVEELLADLAASPEAVSAAPAAEPNA
jgi:DNA segregation ATPase FtsK/SpoIIIE-like protein